MSTSAATICSSVEKRSPSTIIVPFSAIRPLPAKTRSVDDSPKPDETYTYADDVRADCCRTSEVR